MALPQDDRVLLGKLQTSLENLVASHKEERDEGRERNKKLDVITEGMRDVGEKLREQNRAAIEQEVRFKAALEDVKHSQANNSRVLTAGLDLVNVQIKKLEAQIDVTTTKVADLASEQTKIRTEVAEVKSDTKNLQTPVSQFVGMRRAVVAWGGGFIVITGYLFWLFRAAWDDFLHHLMKSIGTS